MYAHSAAIADEHEDWHMAAPREKNAARGEFDEKEDVEATQEDRVDGEQVAGDGGSSMSPEELVPAGVSPSSSGRDALASEHAADGGSRDLVAELAQLARDAQVAPPGILQNQPQNQLSELGWNRPPAEASSPFERCRRAKVDPIQTASQQIAEDHPEPRDTTCRATPPDGPPGASTRVSLNVLTEQPFGSPHRRASPVLYVC